MILLYENNMVSLPENTTWKICTRETEEDCWCLVLLVDDEIEYEILDSDEYIDVTLEEEIAINQVFDLFNRVIHATARILSRATDGSVLDLNPILRREIARWEKEKEEK